MRGSSAVILVVVAAACASGSDSGSFGGDGGNTGAGNGSHGHTTGPGSTTSTFSTTTTGPSTSTTGPSTTSGPTTTSTTTTTTTGPTSTTTGGCTGSPCELVAPECGCPGGDECTIDATGARSCVIAGTGTEGQECSTTGCQPGLICLQITPTGDSCGTFCDVDGDCSGGTICALGLGDGSGNTIPGVALCSTACSPITSSGCSVTGSACQVVQEATGQMRWTTSCYASGAGTQGTTCASSSDCAPGYWCLNSSTSGLVCSHYCNVHQPSCPAGGTCSMVQDANMQSVIIGGVTYGGCL